MGFFRFILNLFSSPDHPSEEAKPDFSSIYNDIGSFTYDPAGFTILYEGQQICIKWCDIERIVAYKADLMTVDEIRMDIFYNGTSLTITEELPGWYQFILKTKSVFPAIPREWDFNIIQPPFATNLTVLYERSQSIQLEEGYQSLSGE